jgi:hypothetical protein
MDPPWSARTVKLAAAGYDDEIRWWVGLWAKRVMRSFLLLFRSDGNIYRAMRAVENLNLNPPGLGSLRHLLRAPTWRHGCRACHPLSPYLASCWETVLDHRQIDRRTWSLFACVCQYRRADRPDASIELHRELYDADRPGLRAMCARPF